MKAMKSLLVVLVLAGLSFTSFGQQQQPNTTITPAGANNPPTNTERPKDVYQRDNIIPEKKPVPYGYLREADVMWAKDIWRIIDLRQRMNYPLRYPTDFPIEDRYSLYLLLMEGIRSEEITPYKYVDFNNPFIQPTNFKGIVGGPAGVPVDTVLGEIRTSGSNIMQFYVREKWYFDKKHSELRVRIVALAPVYFRQDYDNLGNPLPRITKIIPFFVSFDQCRRLFATHSVFNPNNDAQNIPFDDLFMQRRFASTIAAESNVHGNRLIVDYLTGQDALMESEKIKNDIFVFEHDLWEY